ncbi:hypothetical protein MBLNU459_g6839t1 [Dothideomycetes sp. NU459]
MPEIAEVARVVHYLRKHLTNKKLASVQVQEDDIVYGKVGTSASAFKSAMTGKTVLDARQQGKYFWLVMDKPPHPVMHLGMTGWIKFSKDDSSYYRAKKDEGKEEWPPKYWKFMLKTASEDEVAFVDPRRLARIRLVDVAADQLRNTTPLKENGPDPVIDKDILTVDWLSNKMNSKKVPVKALLLDQANISGVGNWVADEVLYQARIHPEQYSNTFSDAQLKNLHDSLIHVCTTAVDLLAESSKFPENWFMRYRWDKGKKGEVNKLPNGDKIVHLKVGGRTSAIVPSVQKKTGAVAGDIAGEDEDEAGSDETKDEEVEKPKGRGRKRKADETQVKEDVEASPVAKRGRKGKAGPKSAANGGGSQTANKSKGGRVKAVKEEADIEEDEDESEADVGTKAEAAGKENAKKSKLLGSKAKAEPEQETGRRRSGRLSGK